MLPVMNSYVKYNAKLRALPIGGLLCVSSAPMFSDNIIALKQSNTLLVVIYPNVIYKSAAILVLDCMPHMHVLNRHLQMHWSTDAINIATSILLDYTSFSLID